MPTTDPRLDLYIAKSPEFARPVLIYLREIVHEGCPEVEETIKWSFPNFVHHGILCSMAAFKEHCSFGFWQAKLVLGERPIVPGAGSFGPITTIKDLPSRRTLVGYVRKAKEVNEQKTPVARIPKVKAPKTELVVPPALVAALAANKAAAEHFAAFSTSKKKEYAEWLGEAKTATTLEKRLATAIEWIAEGKPRYWKYGESYDLL